MIVVMKGYSLMENEVRKCNCPYCLANKEFTKDILEKDGALKCQSCGETFFVSENENKEIEVSKEYHYKKGAGRVFCNCPYCLTKSMAKEEILDKDGALKCHGCGETYFISVNENNEIESSKEYHYKKGAGRVFCNCPYCLSNVVAKEEVLDKDGAVKCLGCGETFFISVNENNEIVSSEKYNHKAGEERAFCNCPQCGMQEIVSREDAQNNDGRKCVACGCINVACLNNETNIIELQPVLKRKRFTHDNKGFVFCNCPSCQGGNVFSDSSEVNKCSFCGTDIFLQITEDDVIASNEELTSISHR